MSKTCDEERVWWRGVPSYSQGRAKKNRDKRLRTKEVTALVRASDQNRVADQTAKAMTRIRTIRDVRAIRQRFAHFISVWRM
jgi:hypothetical protein